MDWREYLLQERTEKLSEVEILSSGRVRSYISTNGVQRETTDENVEKLKADIAEIEEILREDGVPFDS